MANENNTAAGAYRAYRANCPGCGAPVEFRSAASTHAVCGYCSSTVVRSGDQLQRIGKMAELFDDFSPLQLGATGKFENQAFTVVGRLQYAWKEGSWSEWHCAFDGEPDPAKATAWLSEDNGQYVFVREIASANLPPFDALRVGASTAWEGKRYQITAITEVHLASAAGELPKLPELSKPFQVAELRSDDGSILSLDYGTDPPRAYAGNGVQLSGMQLQGLREDSGKEEKGARQFACPNCGAQVKLARESSQSITCGSCSSVIDTSQGTGKELLSALQNEPVRPLISLGSMGELQGVKWQVVGFQHRLGQSPGDDESFGWDEYLLFHRTEGFAFLVDATDGWSFMRPTTGAPDHRGSASTAKYLGKSYQERYRYSAETTYVAGEFYWRANRGERTDHIDFASGPVLLSREQSNQAGAQEVNWSKGNALDAAVVAKAFGLNDRTDDFAREDVAPFASSSNHVGLWVTLIILIIIVVLMMSMCSSRRECDPQRENCSSSYRSGTSGGSYGGWSGGSGGGGGHK